MSPVLSTGLHHPRYLDVLKQNVSRRIKLYGPGYFPYMQRWVLLPTADQGWFFDYRKCSICASFSNNWLYLQAQDFCRAMMSPLAIPSEIWTEHRLKFVERDAWFHPHDEHGVDWLDWPMPDQQYHASELGGIIAQHWAGLNVVWKVMFFPAHIYFGVTLCKLWYCWLYNCVVSLSSFYW